MRVLAIRGANLASLAGEFRVDLEAPPLDRAGLFAISGPTGAGKSTLLDALCLALFDRMPRLPGDRGHLVGRADEDEALRVRSTDPRAILRRGTGAGAAEAEFVGIDGRRYLSRWEVWRARHRPGGRLQEATMTLTDVASGQVLGRTKTETLELVEARLGLTFEQFRRSVLLAQGDFAAFLKAAGRERAELLERVTGTELYSELSRAAHKRAATEREALERLGARLGEVTPLADDERAELEEQLGGVQGEVAAAAARRDAARETVAWHRECAELARAEEQAEAAVAVAAADWEAAADRRAELERAQRVAPARPFVARLDEEAAARGGLERTSEEAAAALAKAEEGVAAHRTALGAADAEIAAARERATTARPGLQRARVLDARLAEQSARVERLEAASEKASERVAEAERVVVRCSEEEEGAGRVVAAAKAWLDEHAGLELLATQWERWRGELGRLASALAEQGTTTAALAELVPQVEAIGERGEEIRREAAAAEAALTAAEAALATASEAAAAAGDASELRRARVAAEASRDHLRRLVTIADEARRTAAARAAHEADDASAAQRIAVAQEDGAALDREIATHGGALAEAQRAHAAAVAAASAEVEALRAALSDGEPCPVCGSTTHPWAGSGPTALLAEEAGARVVELQRRGAGLAERRGAVTAQLEELGRRRSELAADLAELAAAADEARRRWVGEGAGQRLPETPGDAALEALAGELVAVEAELADAAVAEAAVDQCRHEVEAARGGLEAARAAVEESEGAVRRWERDSGELAGERRELTAARDRAAAVVAEAEAALTEPLSGVAGWRDSVVADPDAFVEHCGDLRARWVEQRRVRDQADGEGQRLAAATAAAAGDLRHAREVAAGAAGEAAAARETTGALAAERAALLDGRPADEVEAALEEAERVAGEVAAAAREELEEAERTLAGARRDDEHARSRLAEERAAEASTRGALAAECRRLDLAEDELRRLLERAPEQLAAEAEELAALAAARREAEVVLAERRARRAAHEEEHVVRLTADEAAAALAGAEAALEELQGRRAELAARRDADDGRRARAAELAGERAALEARSRLWEQLRELIGSADGSKLRTFAQSLTLEVLLAHANRHLEELAPRYRLDRVPDSDLELQVVDRDMADEVRSVHSLSGGETFLVSLALALGLASLSSRRTRVESLFIDEGFGSLDPDTLDVALASLDALQAQGRTVGVISHVPAMVERIGLQVKVVPRGAGRSAIEVPGA